MTNSTTTATEICPKCKGTGYILVWKDLREKDPTMWGEQMNDYAVKNVNDSTIYMNADAMHEKIEQLGKMPEAMHDAIERFKNADNEVFLITSTSRYKKYGQLPYLYEFAEPCSWCNGVSHSEANSRDSEMPNDYKGFDYSKFTWNMYDENVADKDKVCKSYIKHFEEYKADSYGVYISSKTKGSGKTYLACCIANTLSIKYGILVKYITMNDYLEKLKLNRKYESHEYTDPYYQCEVLILDDFSQARDSETISKAFYRLIDYRQKNRKPIIFTSNDNIGKVKYDSRIISRIESKAIQVEMPEEDIRHKIASRRLNKIIKRALEEEEE